MLTYAALPGVPMDFLNAAARASWGFIRNQDDRYGVKIVAEEAISLNWQVDDYAYSVPGNFSASRRWASRRATMLLAVLQVPAGAGGGDGLRPRRDRLAAQRRGPAPGRAAPFDPRRSRTIARAWMDDMHDYCNVAH
jgi:hypothetical protein